MISWLFQIPPIYRWLTTLVLIALIIALSVAPGIARPGDSIFVWTTANIATPVQKTMHVMAYATLAFAWVWTLQSVESKLLRFALALLVSLSLGAALEWQQTRVPGRFGTLGDVLLNLGGIVLGLAAALLLL